MNFRQNEIYFIFLSSVILINKFIFLRKREKRRLYANKRINENKKYVFICDSKRNRLYIHTHTLEDEFDFFFIYSNCVIRARDVLQQQYRLLCCKNTIHKIYIKSHFISITQYISYRIIRYIYYDF